MKRTIILLLGTGLLGLPACRKTADQPQPGQTSTGNYSALAKGGGGGGTATPAGPIQNFLSAGASRLVGTHTDSLFVSFTQPAPAGGYTLTVSSANPSAAQVPTTVTVPAGAFNAYIPVTGGNVTGVTSVTITVSLSGQSKTSTIQVFPLHFTFPAASLQSPGNGSSQNFHIMVTFQWAANANAYYSDLQISTSPTFSTLIYEFYTDQSLYPADYFYDPGTNTSTGARYWRVRYIDGAGNGGPWSASRSFTVKPQ